MLEQFISAIGESDCEAIGSGILAQPVNAVSSLAYSIFGLVVLASLRATHPDDRTYRSLFGSLLVFTGVGSVMFHGTQGTGSQFLHDVTFLLTLVFIAVINMSRLLDWSRQRTLSVFGGAGVLLSAIVGLWPESTNMLAGATVAGLVAVDIAVRRRLAVRSRYWWGAIIVMSLALVFFLGGRTGSPFCDSEKLLQGHAMWHILSAAALWLYFEATMPAGRDITT